jgi:hypothetical protein
VRNRKRGRVPAGHRSSFRFEILLVCLPRKDLPMLAICSWSAVDRLRPSPQEPTTSAPVRGVCCTRFRSWSAALVFRGSPNRSIHLSTRQSCLN